MPYKLTAFVEEETEFKAITRAGGDLDMLKRFLASGMPVMIEKGFVLPKYGWMGHYVFVTGYDDSKERLVVQDSYLGPNQVVTYDDLQTYWRAFNFAYIIVYPSERTEEIETILGPNIDEKYAFRSAVQIASNELYWLPG